MNFFFTYSTCVQAQNKYIEGVDIDVDFCALRCFFVCAVLCIKYLADFYVTLYISVSVSLCLSPQLLIVQWDLLMLLLVA